MSKQVVVYRNPPPPARKRRENPRSGVYMAPRLRPVSRVKIASVCKPVNWLVATGIAAATFVADPTNSAAFAMQVFNWPNRFAGFQQYRIRSTEWQLVPLRKLGTSALSTFAQVSGYVYCWINDEPQVGVPTNNAMLTTDPRAIAHCNSDKVHRITYTTNEPQDLNLTQVGGAPVHITGNVGLELGQHAFQVYGDDVNTGINNTLNITLFTVRCIYDIEFFGVGFD